MFIENTPPFTEKYFADASDCPGQKLITQPLPLGHLYCYVPSSYLNGLINLVKVISVVVVNRYLGEDGYQGDDGVEGQLPKKVVRELLVNDPKKKFQLKEFDDDVLILGEVTDGCARPQYLYFWFDHDSSDCVIGRFASKEIKNRIIAEFEFHALNHPISKSYGQSHGGVVIPPDRLVSYLEF